MRSIAQLAALIIALPIAGHLASAQAGETPQLLLDETFTDGELAGGADQLDASWFRGGGASPSIIDDTAGLGAGNALQYLGTGNFSRVTAAFDAPIPLVNAGDKITVELRLRMTRFSEANEGGIRFGLHHDNGAPITSENVGESWSGLTAGWDGYYFRGGVGSLAGMRIFKDLPGASGGAMGGSADITLGNGTGWALGDTDEHAVRIEVLRTSNGQNLLRFFIDQEMKQEISTATAGGEMSEYTNFTIGTGGTEVDLVVDDVVISISVEDSGPLESIDLEARLLDWTPAGVEGGIPTYTNVIDFLDAGGDPSGRTNSSPLLNEILSGLREDTVITFPAGVYRFDRRIIIDKARSPTMPGVIFRGAGTRETKLLFMEPNAVSEGLFELDGQITVPNIPIEGGLTRGSTSVTLEKMTGVTVGRWLWIRQDNDPDAMATIRTIPDYAASIDNQSGWAKRTVGQIVKVAAVDGNIVTLDRPLHLDFTWPNPTASVIRPLSGVGFEDFTIENGLDTPSRSNFGFENVANCWIRNVHSLMAMRNHVRAWGSANLTICDSYFNDAYRHDGGGHGYGTLLNAATTHCLVENNIFRNLRHSMIWKEGANGNVFAYNYSTDGNQSDTPIAKDISGHGHYAFGNLIEGNIVQFIQAADYWGPIGPNNMFLRNRTTHERILIEDGTKDQSIIGNELVSPTSPFVVVDNTSTGAFVHGNNEGGRIQWRSDEGQVVADTYYYAEEPAFWNIDDPWPAIGPEFEAGANTIPAKFRWENGNMEEFAAPVPEIESQPASIAVNGGGAASFGVQALVLGPASYQWRKDGVNLADGGHISGATSATLSLSGVSNDDSGIYTLVITSERGSTTSSDALLSLWSSDSGQLSNLSTRGQVLSGNNILIAGFVIAGADPKTVLIRGIGPSLGQFVGTEKALADSILSVFSGSTEILSNDDWWSQSDPQAVANLADQLGAFPISTDTRDAALSGELSAGAYSVHLAGKDGTGIGLVELYDGSASNNSRLMNISTRGRVGTGDSVMVPGIVVTDNSRSLLIRGVGPELAASFGFSSGDVLPDPVITLTNQDGDEVATNDDWSLSPDAGMISLVAQQVGAFPLTEGSPDAVLLIEVPPGVYTALISDASGGEGIAIVEVYAAP